MTQENITSIWSVISLDSQVFSSDTQSAVMNVIDISDARLRLERNNRNAHSILSFGRELLSKILWKDFWETKTIAEASELIRMRTAIAANDPDFLQQANGK